MAIDQGVEIEPSREVATKRRTVHTTIRSYFGQVPIVEAQREKVQVYTDNGELKSQAMVSLVRYSLADVAADSVTLHDGTVLTGAQMGEAVSLWNDKMDQQQMKAAARLAEAEAALVPAVPPKE